MKKKLVISVACLALLIGAVAGGIAYKNKSSSMTDMNHGSTSTPQSHATYSLNLMSGKSYMAAKPQMLHFAIQDQDGKTLKDFDTVHEKKMHLIVVRKDRTNFQHVHPTLDESTGMFMIEPFTFPTDGEYRVFADFTASSAQKDEMGMKLPATPYQDVQVGDLGKYTPQPLGDDRLTSSANGIDTKLSVSQSHDSPSVPGAPIYPEIMSTIVVLIDKNGQAYKGLQTYLGSLGHMVVLGPNLEFVHAHAGGEDVVKQTGAIAFSVTFPKDGQYKLYLQTQDNNQVNTTDYVKTISPAESSTSQDGQSMQGMDHMSH